jgi:hypothetical protein
MSSDATLQPFVGLPSHQQDIDQTEGNRGPCPTINSRLVENNKLSTEVTYLKAALHAKEQELAKTTGALHAVINEMHYPIARKCVRWGGETPSPPSTSRLHGSIIRSSKSQHYHSPSFTITVNIGGETYTCYFQPRKLRGGMFQEFENALYGVMKQAHKPMLRLALSRGYVLRFRRGTRTSATSIEMGDPEGKEAAFNGFLNGVYHEAKVSLEWS